MPGFHRKIVAFKSLPSSHSYYIKYAHVDEASLHPHIIASLLAPLESIHWCTDTGIVKWRRKSLQKVHRGKEDKCMSPYVYCEAQLNHLCRRHSWLHLSLSTCLMMKIRFERVLFPWWCPSFMPLYMSPFLHCVDPCTSECLHSTESPPTIWIWFRIYFTSHSCWCACVCKVCIDVCRNTDVAINFLLNVVSI